MAKFLELIQDFESAYVPKLSAPTRAKYTSLLRCHVSPGLGLTETDAINTRLVDGWLGDKAAEGLSWATRMQLRALVSGIFRRAEIWRGWTGDNPARRASAGRKAAVREKKKLSVRQTRQLLEDLKPEVRIICMVALFCGLRISEVMGLEWRHVDLERGLLLIRQRWYRGDLDRTKTDSSVRDVPLGELKPVLRKLHPGGKAAAKQFCFSVESARGVTRDDRTIRRILRRSAEKLAIYHPGFGFHSLRREAITAVSSKAGVIQASRLAGHTRLDVTLLYGLADVRRQERAIRSTQRHYTALLKA